MHIYYRRRLAANMLSSILLLKMSKLVKAAGKGNFGFKVNIIPLVLYGYQKHEFKLVRKSFCFGSMKIITILKGRCCRIA